MTTYEHRQIAHFLIFVQLLIIALAVPLLLLTGEMPVLLFLVIAVTAACIVAVIAVFLKTRVDGDGVSWALTFGFPRGFVAFSNITTIERTKLGLLEGYASSGEFTTRSGWLWSPGGREAVTILTRDGRRVTLGTNRQQQLYEAIVERLSKPIA